MRFATKGWMGNTSLCRRAIGQHWRHPARAPANDGLGARFGQAWSSARLLGEVCQRRDDVPIVARSPPYATANHDCDVAHYIGCRNVSALDGLVQGIVRHFYSGIEVEITPCSSWSLMGLCPGRPVPNGSLGSPGAAAVRVACGPRPARCGRAAREGPLHGGHRRRHGPTLAPLSSCNFQVSTQSQYQF